MVLCPTLALIYFAQIQIQERMQTMGEVKRLQALSTLVAHIGDFVHEAPKERGQRRGDEHRRAEDGGCRAEQRG